MKVSDFKPLGKLPDVYELQKGPVYLVIADGKKFSYKAAHALLQSVQNDGVNIHIIATLHPKDLLVGTGTVEDGEDGSAYAGADESAGEAGGRKVSEGH